MNKDIKNRVIPKLRFPDFIGNRDWTENTLGQSLLQHPEYGINAPAVPYSKNLPMYLRITDISVDGFFIKDQMVSVGKDVTEANYLKEGDIVITRTGASVGKSYKYRIEDGELVFAGFLIRVTPDKARLNSELLFQYLFTDRYWKWVSFISARSGQPGINGNEFASMPITLPPSLEEQQKIADCLSSLDKLITAEKQKLEEFKTHKKGLMQQLFPAEGEIVPELRFAEFKNSGEWAEKTLKDVCQLQAGKFVSASEINEQIKGNLFACYGGNGLRGYTMSFTHEGKYSLIGRQGALCGNVTLATGKFHATEHAVVVTPKENVNTDWLFYMLVHLNLNQYATGQAQPGLSVDNLEKVEIKIPVLEKEQQQIASFLSSLDELITEQAEKIAQLKLHKKGLMQGMFPNVNNAN